MGLKFVFGVELAKVFFKLVRHGIGVNAGLSAIVLKVDAGRSFAASMAKGLTKVSHPIAAQSSGESGRKSPSVMLIDDQVCCRSMNGCTIQ